MTVLERLDVWHKTRSGLLVFTLVELLLAYVFASFAIDSGSWWDYLLTLVFLVGGLQTLLKLIKNLVRQS